MLLFLTSLPAANTVLTPAWPEMFQSVHPLAQHLVNTASDPCPTHNPHSNVLQESDPSQPLVFSTSRTIGVQFDKCTGLVLLLLPSPCHITSSHLFPSRRLSTSPIQDSRHPTPLQAPDLPVSSSLKSPDVPSFKTPDVPLPSFNTPDLPLPSRTPNMTASQTAPQTPAAAIDRRGVSSLLPGGLWRSERGKGGKGDLTVYGLGVADDQCYVCGMGHFRCRVGEGRRWIHSSEFTFPSFPNKVDPPRRSSPTPASSPHPVAPATLESSAINLQSTLNPGEEKSFTKLLPVHLHPKSGPFPTWPSSYALTPDERSLISPADKERTRPRQRTRTSDEYPNEKHRSANMGGALPPPIPSGIGRNVV